MQKPQRVYVLSTLPKLDARVEVIPVDLDKLENRVPKEGVALSALTAFLRKDGIFPVESLAKAIHMSREGQIADKQAHFVEKATLALFERQSG